jgi:hypothetical protein
MAEAVPIPCCWWSHPLGVASETAMSILQLETPSLSFQDWRSAVGARYSPCPLAEIVIECICHRDNTVTWENYSPYFISFSLGLGNIKYVKQMTNRNLVLYCNDTNLT